MQLVVPKGLQLQIMQAAHDDVLAGHLGVAKTYEVIRQIFYWFKMFQDMGALNEELLETSYNELEIYQD